MLHLEPNDGFTSLAEKICNQSLVVLEVKLNRLPFNDSNIDMKALSLALTSIKRTKENASVKISPKLGDDV